MMKTRLLVLSVLLVSIFSQNSFSQQVFQKDVKSGYFNFRPASQTWAILDSIPLLNHPAGRVVVRFDGSLQADAGDRIGLAIALNGEVTGNNRLDVEVNSDIAPGQYKSFAETRVYSVPAGSDTFYAKCLNVVRQNGSGYGYVYGSLTLEFFPAAGGIIVADSMIDFTDTIPGGNNVMKKVTFPNHPAGKVLIHTDGNLDSDPGDRIVITVNNAPSWLVGSGSVALMAYDNNKRINQFTHTRVKSLSAGNDDTLYAISSNVVDISGSGIIHAYAGNLSGEFFPTGGAATLDFTEVFSSTLQLRGAPVLLDSLTINPSVAGKALVQFDGYIISSDSDMIVLAASDHTDWDVDCGNVGIGYTTGASDKYSVFSHSRLYTVTPGSHTYYAIAQNYVFDGGTGLGNVIGNMVVKFYPDLNTGVDEVETATSFEVFPNPASNQLTIVFSGNSTDKHLIQITDLSGRTVTEIQAGSNSAIQIDISSLTNGIYLVRCDHNVKKIVKQ